MRCARWLALLVLGAACAPGDGAPFAGRDVVLIVADSLRAAHLSSYGNARPTSPNLDALAAGGLRFDCVYSQTSWTLPSIASLFTGLEQERHGLRGIKDRLGAKTTALPALFAQSGYRTEAVVQNPLVSRYSGLHRGFDRTLQLDWDVADCARAVQRALEIWREPRDEPLLLYLHLVPPHMPYQPPAPYRGRFAESGDAPAEDDGSIEHCRRLHKSGSEAESDAALELRARYDEHVAFTDATLAPLLEALTSDPRAPLIVFTSDHGEAFMQHGSQGHNATVYDEMLRVPLIVSSSDAPWRAGVHDACVSLLDLAPTLAAWCGLTTPDGQDTFQGLVLDARSPGPASERTLRFSSRYKDRFEKLQLGLRRGRWKAVLDGASGRLELYDIAGDPAETRDLAVEESELAGEFERDLRRWYAQRRAALGNSDGEGNEGGVDAAALRGLGYTGD